MPCIVTKKDGTCTAVGCRGRIRKGEYAAYGREQGLRHPECAALPTERRNAKTGACARCKRRLEAGQGLLHHREERAGGTFRQHYVLTCPGCPAPARR